MEDFVLSRKLMAGLNEVHILTKTQVRPCFGYQMVFASATLFILELKISNFRCWAILSICLRLRPVFGMVRRVWFSSWAGRFSIAGHAPASLFSSLNTCIYKTQTCGDKARKFESNLPSPWSEQGGVCNNDHWQSWIVSMIKNIQRDLERLEQMTKRGNVLSIHVFHAISLTLSSH